MSQRSLVQPVPVEKEMIQSYLAYSMSVIVGRALPHVRDGLKPVQRRILWVMKEMGNFHNRPHQKCARIVGECMGKYHPHGDQAIYDALVRLAQPWSQRYPLIDGQGNFGSMDGFGAAAYRYTEARLARISEELLADIEKESVDFIPNFDGREMEPRVLPSKLPILLLNGASGIAVGMATNIPPHNLVEVLDALIYLIDHPEATVDSLMEYVKGPDFPTGGIIIGQQGIRDIYAKGHGSVVLRGRAEIHTPEKGNPYILITELPYQVKRQDPDSKNGVVDQIKKLREKGTLNYVSEVRNESDVDHGTRIIVELKRDANPEVVLNKLYKYTDLQVKYHASMRALVDIKLPNGEVRLQPRLLTLKEILSLFLEHRVEVVTRRLEYDLRQEKKREHLLEGRIKILEDLDKAIRLIRESENPQTAKKALMEAFELSEIQASDILERRLSTLTKMDRQNVLEEYKKTKEKIAFITETLNTRAKLMNVIREEFRELQEKYGDERRTQILNLSGEEGRLLNRDEEDLIHEMPIVIALTQKGYIRSVPLEEYSTQHRGGVGVSAFRLKEDDALKELIVCSNKDHILFFTNSGRAFALRGYQIPKFTKRSGKGTPISTLVKLQETEKITNILAVSEFDDERSIMFATQRGYIKRLNLKELKSIRSNGKRVITLDTNDSLASAMLVASGDRVVLGTYKGLAVHFSVDDVRPMGTSARGVIGIRFKVENDYVVGGCRADANKTLLTITERGYGKRTAFDQYRLTRRGAKGVKNINLDEKSGNVTAIKAVHEDDDVLAITSTGRLIRTPVSEIRETKGRDVKGVRIMKLKEKEYIVDVAIARHEFVDEG